MTNINNRFAETLVQAGAKMGLDFANDETAQKDAQRQILLGGQISKIMAEQADPKNPITARDAVARTISEGSKLGIAPKVSVGLYSQMSKAINAKANQKGMKPSEYLNAQLKAEQIQESRQRQVERGLKISERANEVAAPARSALNQFKSAFVNAREAAGKNASFEEVVDELGDSFPVETGTFERNVSNDPQRIAQVVAQTLMQQSPELSERFGVGDLTDAVMQIMQNPNKSIEDIIGTPVSEVENAPTPDSVVSNAAGA
jgi:hypothetical protein